MNEPLISIITVTFNAGEVIEPTLRSVSEQSFGDYEHIVVDGGSTDATLALASRFRRPGFEIHSKPDSGIYHGMNRGLDYARGRYVVFLNAGDRFASPQTLAQYAAAIAEGDPAPDIVYGDTVIVDADGRVLRPRHLKAPELLTYNSYLDGMLVCHQAFMVRREIAPKYSREFKLSADYDWCLACIANSGLTRRRNLRTVTVHYLDGGMSQKRKLASLRERFIIMRRRFGLGAALRAHLGFIPRALRRLVRVTPAAGSAR